MSCKDFVHLLENCAVGFDPVQVDNSENPFNATSPSPLASPSKLHRSDVPYPAHRSLVKSSQLTTMKYLRRILLQEEKRVMAEKDMIGAEQSNQLSLVKYKLSEELAEQRRAGLQAAQELEELRRHHGRLAAIRERVVALRERALRGEANSAKAKFLRLRQQTVKLRKDVEEKEALLFVARRRFASKKRRLRELKLRGRSLSKEVKRLEQESAEMTTYLERSALTREDDEEVAAMIIQAAFRRCAAATLVEKSHRTMQNLEPLVALLRRKIVVQSMILERNLEEMDSINENVEPELMCDLCFLTLRQPEISPETGHNCCRRCLRDAGKYGSTKTGADHSGIPNQVLDTFMKCLKQKARTFAQIADASQKLRADLLRSSVHDLIAQMR